MHLRFALTGPQVHRSGKLAAALTIRVVFAITHVVLVHEGVAPVDRTFGSPEITKDGVSVAKKNELQDPFENMGAQLVREVALRWLASNRITT